MDAPGRLQSVADLRPRPLIGAADGSLG